MKEVILELLKKRPLTLSEAAKQLSEKGSKVYFRLKQMVKDGEIRVKDWENPQGSIEKVYGWPTGYVKPKCKRGFASMDPEKHRQIASKGGRASHEKGTGHEFTPEEAKIAGSISGNRRARQS